MTDEAIRSPSSLRFPRAVVTGGCGFLGSHICDALIGAGVEVLALDNFSTGTLDNVSHLLDDPRFSLRETDVTCGIDVPEHVDLVLHLASPASPRDYTRLPLETLAAGAAGTHAALRLALRDRARFVLASTSEVYGDPLQHPQSETYWGHVNPVGPRAAYDEAKRYAEALTICFARTYGLNTSIVRIFNTYGPRLQWNDGRVVPNLIGQALLDEPLTLYGDGTQTRSLCYVSDTVRGILALAASRFGGPVNIGSTEEVTVHSLALRIRELVGSHSALRFLPPLPDDPCRRRPDISLARRELRWRPRVSLGSGLRATIAAFRAAGTGSSESQPRSQAANPS
ncbi:NAD-dependent epimerase/dehydratase family protein [Nonomuraea insulae]|uniref:NAD-dependent epimerase/dehydratase family protein n=1 Tax=Nonomuraea insulae TaxID=1616787 RepID=A0ABW1D688_9ACTN